MKKMFVPLHLTALSIAGFALDPDQDRMVSVPDDKLDECLGHGLIPAENEEAINAYLDTVDTSSPSDEDPEDEDEGEEPPAKKPAVKKAAAKKAKPTARKRA